MMREKKVKSDPSQMPQDCEELSQQCGSLDEGSSTTYRRKSELSHQRKARHLGSQFSKKRLLDYWQTFGQGKQPPQTSKAYTPSDTHEKTHRGLLFDHRGLLPLLSPVEHSGQFSSPGRTSHRVARMFSHSPGCPMHS